MATDLDGATGFDGRHAVVTGGTGALGTAVVTMLLARGAVCHIPVFDAAEKARGRRSPAMRMCASRTVST